MNIAVLIKQVPDPEVFKSIKLDLERNAIIRKGIPAVINPLDKHALEEAIRTREKGSGKIVAISLGPPQASRVLEDALALGVDEAVLLSDEAFASSDTLATASALAGAIRKLKNIDLIFCGNESIDSATGQVPAQISELLGIGHITSVTNFAVVDDQSVMVKQKLENEFALIEMKLPALIAVKAEINTPRYPTCLGMVACEEKKITIWNAKDIGVDENEVGLKGSPTRVGAIKPVGERARRHSEKLEGSPEEVARKAVKKLRQFEIF